MITNELVVGFLTDEDLAEGRATLGEWSVTRRQFSQQVREVMDAIPAPFPTHSEVEQISEYLRKQCDACLPKLAAHVSKSWGEEHSDRFWRILLMPWVTYGLMTLYERERRLSKYFAAHKTDRLLLFGVPTARPEVRVVRDFSRQAIGGDLNGILCQWLLAENAPSQQDWPSVVEVKRSESVEDRQEAPARQGLISRLSGMINAMLPVQYIGGMGIGFRIRLSLSLMFSQKRTAASAEELPVSSNNEIGSDLVSPFLCDPLKFLIEFCPRDYLSASKWEAHRTCLLPSSTYVVSTGVYMDEGLKLGLAKRVEETASAVVGVQHGCAYGSFGAYLLPANVEYSADEFLTWGWTGHAHYPVNAHPLPAPILSKVPQSCSCCEERILYISTVIPFGRTIIQTGLSPERYWQTHDQRIEFLETVKAADLIESVSYRPHLAKWGTISDADFLIEKFAGLTLLKEPSLHPHLIGSKLVVLDHPGTTLLICLAWNIPVIAHWNEEHYLFTDESRELFDQLAGVGIVHRTGAEAGNFLAEKIGGIDAWWGSVTVQELRESWCHECARHSPDWRQEWLAWFRSGASKS